MEHWVLNADGVPIIILAPYHHLKIRSRSANPGWHYSLSSVPDNLFELLWLFLADIFAVLDFLEANSIINQFAVDVANKKTEAYGEANITRLTGL